MKVLSLYSGIFPAKFMELHRILNSARLDFLNGTETFLAPTENPKPKYYDLYCAPWAG